MKFLKTVLVLVLLFPLITASHANNIFDDLKDAESKLPQKYTLVYLYTSWCGGSRMEFDTLSELFLKHRDDMNFVVLTDSISYQHLSEKIKSLKPDAFVMMDKYFKKRSHSIKEASELGAQFEERYQYEWSHTMLASGSFYLEFPNHNLMKFFWSGNAPRVEAYLSSIPICH